MPRMNCGPFLGEGLRGSHTTGSCMLRPLAPFACLQLRCGGVLEAVRISCAGYPTKMPVLDFIDHFWMLGLDAPQLDDREYVRHILRSVLGDEGWQFGKTKVRGGGW